MLKRSKAHHSSFWHFTSFSWVFFLHKFWQSLRTENEKKNAKASKENKREKMDANFTKGPWGLQEIMASSGGLRALWHMALTQHAAHTHTRVHTDAPAHNVSVRGTSPQRPGEMVHTRQRLWAEDGRSSVMKSNQYCANDSDEMLLHIESVEAMFALPTVVCFAAHAWSYCFKKNKGKK